MPGLAWPESPGLGLALEGSGLIKPQARPYKRACAWLGPGSGPGQGSFRPYETVFNLIVLLELQINWFVFMERYAAI